ncbi:MAG TPA: hypothetical protein VLK84_08065 [Longimicrobium sp.]|nr:hypothetical protein [Longimicrobium sp.]
MRKLKLSIEALAVQSFDTAPLVRGLGTVHGRDQDQVGLPIGGAATHPDCPSPFCMDTPLASCDGTCGRPGCTIQPLTDVAAAADTA